VHGS
jgi:hypothetical protein